VPLPSCSKSPTSSFLRQNDPEYEDTMVFETSKSYSPNDAASHPKRHEYSTVPLGEAQVLHLNKDTES